MAGQSGAGGEATTERISDEVRSVTASAKLNMRKLEAELLFLLEADAVSTEVNDMTSSLAKVIRRVSPRDSPPRKTVQGIFGQPSQPIAQVLQTPLRVSVKTEYAGPDYRYLMALAGDDVIVHAWVNFRKTAVAYNPRNDMCGHIPANLLEEEGSQPVRGSDLCRASTEKGGAYTLTENGSFQVLGFEFGDLAWRAGDYIRICRWDDREAFRGSRGIGFNLTSIEIGPFHGHGYSLKSIGPTD